MRIKCKSIGSVFITVIFLLNVLISVHAQTVSDYDGNVYDTVIIGSQVWLKQNLKVTHYNNGDPIPNVISTNAWSALVTGARCYYNNDSLSYDSVYGALYNSYAVNNVNKLCPDGWHVPTNAEWTSVENYLGGVAIAGGKMKESGTLHWGSPNTGATNSTGFTGLPGGMRDPVNNDFRTIGENGLWWTSSVSGTNAGSTYMWYLFAGIDHNPAPRKYGFSIRCVKDVTTGTGTDNSTPKIKFYPNPVKDYLVIECAEYKNINVLIFNIIGEQMLYGVLTDRITEIDISALPKGVYFLRSSDEHLTIQQKLIKE